MRLWLDDCRPAPEGWHRVRTAEEAIAILKEDIVEEASLDHDLDRTISVLDGTSVVDWLERHPEYLPSRGVVVHSMNPV